MKNKRVEMLSVEQRHNLLFASRLREALDASDFSRAKLAQLVGISPQMVSHYCLGNNVPQISVLIEIAKVLNVSADYLLGLTDNESVRPEIRSMSEYTGLNTASIETLHKHQSIPLFVDVLNFLLKDLQFLESIADYLTTPLLDIRNNPLYDHVELALPIFDKLSAFRAADLYTSAGSAQDSFAKSNTENDILKTYIAERYISKYGVGSRACNLPKPSVSYSVFDFYSSVHTGGERSEREEFLQSLEYFGIDDIDYLKLVKTARGNDISETSVREDPTC